MDAIEELKKIGLQKISDETHIYIENLKSLLNKDFSVLHKTKTFGFIQILEKKYNVDLSDLKKEYQLYLKENKPKEEKITILPPKQPNYKNIILYLLLTFAILVLISFYIIKNSTDQNSTTSDLNVVQNSAVLKETQKNLDNLTKEISTTPISQEQNITVDLDTIKNSSVLFDTDNNIDQNISNQIQPLHQTLVIKPATSLWVGIIYLDNYQRKSYLTSKEIDLDPSRDQLILTGHSKFDILHNNELAFFSSEKKVRFLYQDGTLSEITQQEFKELNGGVEW